MSEELIDGKFRTQEDLLKSYKELEAESTKLREKLASFTPQIPAVAPGAERPVASTGTPKPGNLASILARILQGDPEVETAMIQEGVDPSAARMLMDHALETQNQYVQSVYKAAGGKAAYEEMLRWAAEDESMTAYERTSFLAEIRSQNPSRVHSAVRSMKDRYEEETGYEPAQLVLATNGKAPERVKGFSSTREFQNAFADPRYGQDGQEEYTRLVQARAQVTDDRVAGTDEMTADGEDE